MKTIKPTELREGDPFTFADMLDRKFIFIRLFPNYYGIGMGLMESTDAETGIIWKWNMTLPCSNRIVLNK